MRREKTPQRIDKILKRLLKRIENKRKDTIHLESIEKIIKKEYGRKSIQYIKIRVLKDNTLSFTVQNPSLAHDMAAKKSVLLKKINDAHGNNFINDIYFRIGS